ncbi:DUF6230 family protein [Streptomyces sp. GS7]|uniref:DUF6230 family protein n=1 Tax=Streptomyces sp. GS7 TaxID=2692234 RepID=UPI0013166920|nr:DUF6230 family protein [Streptomyces sp. GS7]QHC21483.1 hypothetical protein GR130_08690 [Streptomyces sp. GS7]
MTAPSPSPPDTAGRPTVPARRSGTNCRRLAIVVALSGLAAAITIGGMQAAAMPVSFAVTGSTFQVSAKQMHGVGAVQFASLTSDAAGHDRPAAVAGISRARLTGLCQSSVAHTPLGAVTLRIEADDGRTTEAHRLVLGLSELKGDMRFGEVEMGRDAATLDAVAGVHGASGQYGQQARTLDVDGMRLTSQSITAGSFDLSGARMHVQLGDHPCF